MRIPLRTYHIDCLYEPIILLPHFTDISILPFKFVVILVNMGIVSMLLQQMWRYNKIHFAIITFKQDCIYVFKYITKNKSNKVGLHNVILNKLV